MSIANNQVLLVDDDETIIETLEYNLKRQGFSTRSCNSGQQALASLDAAVPDLIVLDWTLPDMAGPDICNVIRVRGFEMPVLMLTGRNAPTDVAHGLSKGADDYLTKPFSIIEFMARVQSLLRRTKKQNQAGKISVGELVLDEDARQINYKGKKADLSPKEYLLLKLLMQNPGKTISTEALLNQVWGYDFTGDAKTVAVHIRWLRQKLEDDAKNPQLLQTVHRSGYRLSPNP